MEHNAAQNKRAFDEVIGDPFAIPEPVDGFYIRFRNRSTMGAQQYNFDEGHATRNPAQPSQLDFLCDVEKVLEDVLRDKTLLNKFINTYIVGDIDSTNTLSQSDRTVLEQRIGNQLRTYKISPVGEYFRTIRTGSTGRR